MTADDRDERAAAAHAPEKVEKARAFCEELFRAARRRGCGRGEGVARGHRGLAQAARRQPVELHSALVEAVQALANRVVNPLAEGRKWVNLEVGGFREDGDPAVKAMAERLADERCAGPGRRWRSRPSARASGGRSTSRCVGAEGVATRSEGEGLFRQLLVFPAAKRRAERRR